MRDDSIARADAVPETGRKYEYRGAEYENDGVDELEPCRCEL